MARPEELTIDCQARLSPAQVSDLPALNVPVDEHAARVSLRAQIARLERDLSEMVASGFPHISVSAPGSHHQSGPHLLTLAELELLRDRLAMRVQDTRILVARRAEFQHNSRTLLEQMKLEPGRYKFVRLPVANLGLKGCGAWEVRPRLGLIGMLAGWWHVKLSSGCPLPRGCAGRRSPGDRPSQLKRIRSKAVQPVLS